MPARRKAASSRKAHIALSTSPGRIGQGFGHHLGDGAAAVVAHQDDPVQVQGLEEVGDQAANPGGGEVGVVVFGLAVFTFVGDAAEGVDNAPAGEWAIAHGRLADIRDRERIVIYGDYDVDGITATAILWHAITTLGGTLTYTIKVSNVGTQDAANIHVRDTLPADTMRGSASRGTSPIRTALAGDR